MKKCEHKHRESMYGFASSYGFRGLGVYEFCTDCFRLIDWSDDLQCNTQEEVDHNAEQLKVKLQELK